MRRTRTRRSESEWRRLIERQRRTGATITEFCGREGIYPTVFRRWRHKLGGVSAAEQGRMRLRPAARLAGEFIELSSLRSTAPRRTIRLELGSEIVLHLSGK